MDINRDTPICPDRPFERRYECVLCEHVFTVFNGFDSEVCPGCDEQVKAKP
jgi:rRNA maturation endonuclease Nob1